MQIKLGVQFSIGVVFPLVICSTPCEVSYCIVLEVGGKTDAIYQKCVLSFRILHINCISAPIQTNPLSKLKIEPSFLQHWLCDCGEG